MEEDVFSSGLIPPPMEEDVSSSETSRWRRNGGLLIYVSSKEIKLLPSLNNQTGESNLPKQVVPVRSPSIGSKRRGREATNN